MISDSRFPLRLGTRASPLALAQAHEAKARLTAQFGWDAHAIEIVPVTASGDRVLDRALAEVGGKALWTKELDQLLGSGETDFSVHSMKDVETIRPEIFVVAAMLKRADVRDRLIGAPSIDGIPKGARVGTSAPRRTAQLLRLRPDLDITLFRGNVQTRLRKLADGEADATLLAAAGLSRMGMDDIGTPIPLDVMLPAPSQGAIGLECRAEDIAVRELLSVVNDGPSCRCVDAERSLLAALGADCRSPVAALAVERGGAIHLRAQILSLDGAHIAEGETVIGPGETTAEELAQRLLARAAPPLRKLFAGA